jgi:dTDP-4-amino-4,6-dideoxygalactose transaminase
MHVSMPVKLDPTLFPQFPLADYNAHKADIDLALERMLSAGHYILGEEVSSFEAEFADYIGTRHSIGVANGTDAIEVLLRALDIGRGDKVAVPSHTAVASASGIGRAGATPVFVDIDSDTATMCPEALDRLLKSEQGKGIKAALVVHLYGHPAAWDRLESVAAAHGITLLEDCAQAHGATFQGRKVGSLAKAAAFSFYPTKNLGGIGDGGAITCSDDALATRIREIRQYGWRERYISACEGVNSRLDEMQAAILRVKLRSLPASIIRRRELAAAYGKGLAGCGIASAPVCRADSDHAYHLYVVRSEHRDRLMHHLIARGVPAALHYPAAIHQQSGYYDIANQSPALPKTDEVMKRILTLPLHPHLSELAVQAVCEVIREVV